MVLTYEFRLADMAPTPIVHVTDRDWAKCLDESHTPARRFDDEVDVFRKSLNLAPMARSEQRDDAQMVSKRDHKP